MLLIDLIEALQEQLDNLDEAQQGTAEVRLMTQQNWPFENGIAGVVAASDIGAEDHDEDDEGEEGYTPCDEPGVPVVYITEGRQIGYGTKGAWQ